MEIPPQDEWGLDPIYWSYVLVLISQVHSLDRVENLPGAFVFSNSKRPVSKVELVGHLVNVKPEGSKATIYALDDGTGLIQATKFLTHEDGKDRQNLTAPYGLGDRVRVRGTLSLYAGNVEVKVVAMNRLTDPNEETLHWLSAIKLARTYSSPLLFDDTITATICGRALEVSSCVCESDSSNSGGFRRSLHYCKCTATPAARDPDLVFRFELLKYLEEQGATNISYNHLVVACEANSSSLQRTSDLSEAALRTVQQTTPDSLVAENQRPLSTSTDNGISISQRVRALLRQTLAQLRRDGLLFHHDQNDSDDFLDSRNFLRPLLLKCLPGKTGPQPGILNTGGIRSQAEAIDRRIKVVPDTRLKLCLLNIRTQK
mmetsp:Transcript_34914/g.78893  ORF Transcript_34914/g.78893 Transcript_34914/m.78893 type:complete len:373 (+) Transcript_34914:121-1239(+)|eukprot:CAMPEP_0172643382 /NCGR_PEP_ID=MMETSP1068-20121228/236753_1 /TAXON_ID=35684 /ORGANISM="Pseudopedinella elastica, Strain CCMP716" /LENGTH=372 /DNA_ID=CAMNT_0013457435 /DNA_START=87 /DNA_END=1205 /DNA_ORIENTATION=-